MPGCGLADEMWACRLRFSDPGSTPHQPLVVICRRRSIARQSLRNAPRKARQRPSQEMSRKPRYGQGIDMAERIRSATTR